MEAMPIRPRSGSALVRPVRVADRLPGSAIILVPQTVEKMTAQQVELVAMGPPPERDDVEPFHADLDACLQSLPEGSWLVVKPWTALEATSETLFIPQDAILAVLG